MEGGRHRVKATRMESHVLNRLKLRCQSDLPMAFLGVWLDVGFRTRFRVDMGNV